MANNQSKTITVLLLFGLAAASWYAFTNLGNLLLGNNIFGGITSLVLGVPLAIIFTSLFAIFGIAALMLDVQSYPTFFLASVVAIVALVLWLSPADIPGPVEELLVSLVSGLLFKKSVSKKQNQQFLGVQL